MITKITESKKELWASEVHLRGTGRLQEVRLILTGLWMSRFSPPMFLNQKVRLSDEDGYVLVSYVDYPILKAEQLTSNTDG